MSTGCKWITYMQIVSVNMRSLRKTVFSFLFALLEALCSRPFKLDILSKIAKTQTYFYHCEAELLLKTEINEVISVIKLSLAYSAP